MDNRNIDHDKILLVEDEESLAAGLEYNLIKEGYQVLRAEDGRVALKLLTQNDFDLVILDIMLPFLNGFDLIERIRENTPTLPVLILSSLILPKDKIKGLSLGADDYLTKPFHLDELLLRVQGMLRRKSWYRESLKSQSEYEFNGIRINFEKLTCQSKIRSFRLTPLEGALLKYFVENEGHIITREILLKEVWQVSSETDTRTVENFIMRLRKYFEPEPSKPVFIQNIRGKGYIFYPNNN